MRRRFLPRSSARRRSGKPLRSREWSGFNTSQTGIFGEPSSVLIPSGNFDATWLIHPNDAEEFFDTPTVVRIIVRVSAFLNVTAGQFTGDTIEQLFTIGITTWQSDLLGPPDLAGANDPTKDWMWREAYQFYGFPASPNKAFQLTSNAGQGDLYDIRAKRIIKPGHGLAITWDNTPSPAGSAVVGVRFGVTGRYLLLNG